MSASSKRYNNNKELIEENQKYMVDEAISLLKKTGNTKFKESIDVAINLGIDPKQTEQNVRGSVVLPNGTGKNMRVIVFAESVDAEAAKTAGADEVGAEDLAEKIKAGFSDFDIVIATPSSMKIVGQLGQILGPKGMMPNPKDGTVTKNIKEAVTNAKKGQAMFRNDKGGVLHCSIGRVEFTEESIKENLLSLITQVNKSKPSSAKGIFIKKITLSSTMGPGIHVEESSI
ncbi:MAG: 50S ribosomal protein L1 [Gammaproteobacteria bacterium]|jgi:large subunit ribosomal protein L1|nr:50S ribosomal protein L1 [Gammaproteobacteria bacterium]MBT6073436.1 50S ribosomal protein L1 [Gammaproteobacteria bacterium]MBT7754198.1 50S ribosomal protein L1 [Gammaproteobacteria bacterium]MDG2434885.1 50S ribosomal protein L1 [Gammaproteobacteria bacterium]